MLALEKAKVKLESEPGAMEYSWVAGQLFEQGQLEEALAIVNGGLQHNPNDIIGMVVQAKIKFAMDDVDHSKELWKSIAENRPSTGVAYKYLVEIALVQNNAEESREYFQKLKALDPWYSISSNNDLIDDDPIFAESVEDETLDFSDSLNEQAEIKIDNNTSTLESLNDESVDELQLDALELDEPFDSDETLFNTESSEIEEPLLNFDNEENDLATTGVDGDAIGSALDEMFGNDLDEDLEFSSGELADDEESENLFEDSTDLDDTILDTPALENEDSKNPESYTEGLQEATSEIVNLPPLVLEDDEDILFGDLEDTSEETSEDTTNGSQSDIDFAENDGLGEDIEESLALQVDRETDVKEIEPNDSLKANEEIVTGDDVSDALDEIFGDLEDDDFDSSLSMEVASNPEELFEDSEKVIDEMVDSNDLDEVLPDLPQTQEAPRLDEDSSFVENLSDAVVSELDALFEDDLKEINSVNTEAVKGEKESLESSLMVSEDIIDDGLDDNSIFANDFTDFDHENEELASSEETEEDDFLNNFDDELISEPDSLDDLFAEESSLGDLNDSTSTAFFNIEGENADQEVTLDEEALESIDVDESISTSLDKTTEVRNQTPTVTLAEIHFEQGHYKESIEMYHALLKLDEHNQSYIDRIEEIKKQID